MYVALLLTKNAVFGSSLSTTKRPRYDPNPACSYDAGVLNFALHVRMGDRRFAHGTNNTYFSMLEELMDGITDSVLKKGKAAPVFHIFTETLEPCPSTSTGEFDEFPNWPVELGQVRRLHETHTV